MLRNTKSADYGHRFYVILYYQIPVCRYMATYAIKKIKSKKFAKRISTITAHCSLLTTN